MGSCAARAGPDSAAAQTRLRAGKEVTDTREPLDPQLKRALAERIRYDNELGIYDFYQRAPSGAEPPEENPVPPKFAAGNAGGGARATPIQPRPRDSMMANRAAAPASVADDFEVVSPK